MIDREELNALADGELSAEQQQALLAQLANDPKATGELHSIQAIKETLRSKMDTPNYDDLWKRCQGRLDEMDKTKRVESFVGRYAWGLCGVFLLAIVMGGLSNRMTGRTVRGNDVVSYVAGLTPIPVSPSEAPAKLDPLLREPVAEILRAKPERMQVVAVGKSDIPGQRVGYVQLGDSFGIVTVLTMPDIRRVDGAWVYEEDDRFRCSKVDGVNALFWNENGVICVVMGQRSYDELHAIITGRR